MATPGSSGRDAARETGPLGYCLALAARRHRADLTRRLAALGLHPGQELIAIDLHRNPASTQAALVERMGIEQPTVAKAVSRMERAGFVLRTPDETDRRVVRLNLSPQGTEVVEAVLHAWRDAEAAIADVLTVDEQRQLTDLLQRIAAPAADHVVGREPYPAAPHPPQ